MKQIIKSLLVALLVLFIGMALWRQVYKDPLPSWNESSTKQNILNFVKNISDSNSEYFVPVEARVATFDQDGTLWVEQPLYTQLFFALDKIKKESSKHPEWQNEEPFSSIIKGNYAELERLTPQDIEKIVSVAFTGMSVTEFMQEVKEWGKTAIHPRFKRPFTSLTYQPMLEVIALLKAHDFKVYIVSGGGQEFIRAFSEEMYGIPPENVIGSAGKVKYEPSTNPPSLLKLPAVLFVDDKGGKVEGINLVIGRKPQATFGNSTGDQEMLEWSQSNPYSLQVLIHHDDEEREYSYGPRSKIGTFSESLMKEAEEKKWNVVSMKKDWKIIFK